jgi:putative acetyltransferase
MAVQVSQGGRRALSANHVGVDPFKDVGGGVHPPLIIRGARQSDARAMAAVRREAIISKTGTHYLQSIVDAWVADGSADREMRYERLIADSKIISLVAEVDDDLLGFGLASPANSELLALYTRPNSVGRVGCALLSRIEQQVFETADTMRCIAAKNAVAFYEANGYRSRGPVDYIDRSNAAIPCMEMEKRRHAPRSKG